MNFTVPPSAVVLAREPAVPKTVSVARVAFAFEGESKRRFLDCFDPGSLPPADYEWPDVKALRDGGWEEFLRGWRPTVLVTSWGTPAIPDGFSHADDLPLRYICHLTGSVSQIVPRRLIERGVLVSNWGTEVSSSVAEHAMLMVLAGLRNAPAWGPFMERWGRQGTPSPSAALGTRALRGKRVGLHGFGSIARSLVEMLRPFEVKISACSWGVPAGLFERYGVHRHERLEDLFAGSDVLVECEALTARSRGSVNEAALRALPDGAVFVNVGRGRVVDEAALVQVARDKGLRLCLDVFHDEPLPADSPLRGLKHTLFSPHVAGPADDAFGGLCEFALDNLRRHLRGEAIEGVVSLDVFDRST